MIAVFLYFNAGSRVNHPEVPVVPESQPQNPSHLSAIRITGQHPEIFRSEFQDALDFVFFRMTCPFFDQASDRGDIIFFPAARDGEEG
jgi:hypothetical protein